MILSYLSHKCKPDFKRADIGACICVCHKSIYCWRNGAQKRKRCNFAACILLVKYLLQYINNGQKHVYGCFGSRIVFIFLSVFEKVYIYMHDVVKTLRWLFHNLLESWGFNYIALDLIKTAEFLGLFISLVRLLVP